MWNRRILKSNIFQKSYFQLFSLLVIGSLIAMIALVAFFPNSSNSSVQTTEDSPYKTSKNGVTIGINDTECTKREGITFWLRNKRNSSIALPSPAPWELQEKLDGKWVKLFKPPSAGVIVGVPPGGNATWIWDQRIYGKQWVGIGSYRIIIASLTFSSPPLPLKIVSQDSSVIQEHRPYITTKHRIQAGCRDSQCSKGEKILFWIKNNRNNTIVLPFPWEIQQKSTHMLWKTVFKPESTRSNITVSPSASIILTWDQRVPIFSTGEWVGPGIYRILIKIYLTRSLKRSVKFRIPLEIVVSESIY